MADSRRRKNQKPQASTEQVVVEAILRGIWSLIMLPFRGKAGSSGPRIAPAVATQLASHWSSVESHLGAPQTYALAVSEGDKLLDAAMQAAGISGVNMGDRLKSASGIFPNDLYQRIWDAHKLRNMVAHEVGTSLSYEQARFAANAFRSALSALGVPV